MKSWDQLEYQLKTAIVYLKGDGERYTKKKTDVKFVNVKYVTLLCILLHNLCIAMKVPCKPRWHLSVQELQLDDFIFDARRAKKNQPISARKLPNGSGTILNDYYYDLLFICKYNFSYQKCTCFVMNLFSWKTRNWEYLSLGVSQIKKKIQDYRF